MTAHATPSTPHDSRNPNPTAAVASPRKLDLSTSSFARPRQKMRGHRNGAGALHLHLREAQQ